MQMHPGQLPVSADLVRKLVHEQFPAWRDLPVRAVPPQGTVNALFRIGADLVARLPLQPAAGKDDGRAELEAEAAAAREFLGRTRFRTPEPVAIGADGDGYPRAWSIQTWLPGTVATEQDPGGSVPFAHDLAEFIADTRGIDTGGRVFGGQGRGGNLTSHEDWMQTCFERSQNLLDVPRLRRMWAELRELPRGPAPDVMSHGDLIPGNILVADGRLSGVIDVGGLGAADPALDLVGAWHVLEEGPRQRFRDDLRVDDLQWRRGMAWAFLQAMGLPWYYQHSNPAMSTMGRRTLDRIMAAS